MNSNRRPEDRPPWSDVLTYHVETTGNGASDLKLLAADLRFTLDAARDAIDHKFENGLYNETTESAAEQYEIEKEILQRLEDEFAALFKLEIPPEGLVVHSFPTERSMTEWLADERNVEELKKRYPPPTCRASVTLGDREIRIHLQ